MIEVEFDINPEFLLLITQTNYAKYLLKCYAGIFQNIQVEWYIFTIHIICD